MANIRIPKRFEHKLKQNQNLDGVVKTTLYSFGEILRDNRLFFFSEYTDHGIEHIQNVLESSDNLITEKTFENVLTEYDIAYLTLSIILHDLGMHIGLDGFKLLLAGDFDEVRIDSLDKLTWRELWDDYINEAKKFNEKQIIAIFGDNNIVIREPDLNAFSLFNEIDKKLIGEFLRRNHARLAHEIALIGFPGKATLRFAETLDFETRNIIGFIARSHGMKLRDCVKYLEKTYGSKGRRLSSKSHSIYLMVLLRISDYIQIDRNRTSETMINLRSLSSPISKLEHKSHLAIEFVDSSYQDDPESIYISASPKESSMFLKLKALFSDIQYELDISWAVLGELYGLMSNKPEIKYRRIVSNLEDEEFVFKQGFIPEQFTFKANDELIKLLIKPLYGDDPSYGVRELLQNSLDACKEKEELEFKQTGSRTESVISVSVINENKQNYIVIKDNGVGMDLNIIKNYFLSVGASYRKNILWQKEFIDNNGKSKVRRSGRFGIGLLAAFLLGDEFYLETKTANSSYGYRFIADLNMDKFNVEKAPNIDSGTLIKIKMHEKVIEKLTSQKFKQHAWYQWYAIKHPQIKYTFLGKAIEPYDVYIPDVNDHDNSSWNSFSSEGYNKIFWSYSNDNPDLKFCCNGIVINYGLNSDIKKYLDLGIIKNVPNISVFDYDAFLPLSLNRNSFIESLTFANDLTNEIYKDFIAYILTLDVGYIDKNDLYLKNIELNYPGLISNIDSIFFTSKGFVVNANYFIEKSKFKQAIILSLNNDSTFKDFKTVDFALDNKFLIFKIGEPRFDIDYRYELDLTEFLCHVKANQSFSKLGGYKSKVVTKYPNINWLAYYNGNLIRKVIGNGVSDIISESFLEKYTTKLNAVLQCKLKDGKKANSENQKNLNLLFKKYLGNDVVIPFSINERKVKFKKAFKELELHMRKYLSTN